MNDKAGLCGEQLLLIDLLEQEPRMEPIPDDRALLTDLRNGAPEALAKVYERHGRMVFNVCLRVLGHAQDAEDATQAVFMVLSDKAVGLGEQVVLAGWLQRAAYWICREVRRGEVRRARREKEAVMTAATLLDTQERQLAWEEVRPALDREIAALPDRFRTPLVMVYLEGRKPEAAALELGIAGSTLRWRLTEALERLRKGLRREAPRLTVVVLAALLSQHTAEAAPGALVVDEGGKAVCTAASASDRMQPYLRGFESAQFWDRARFSAVGLVLALLATGLGAAFLSGNLLQARSSRPAPETQDPTEVRTLAATNGKSGLDTELGLHGVEHGPAQPGPMAAPPELPRGVPVMQADQVAHPAGGRVVLYSRNRHGNYPLASYAFHLGLRGDGQVVGNEVQLVFGNVQREDAFQGEAVDEGPRGLHGAAGMDGGSRDGSKPRDEFRVLVRADQNEIWDLGAVDFAAVNAAPETLDTAGYRVPVVENHVYVLRLHERRRRVNPAEPLLVKFKVLRHKDNDAVMFDWVPIKPTDASSVGEEF